MLRSAIGAIIFGALLLFTVFGMVSGDQMAGQDGGQATDTAQMEAGQATDGSANQGDNVTQEFAEPTPESWFDEGGDADTYDANVPIAEPTGFEPAPMNDPIADNAAPQYDPAPSGDDAGGWGEGG